MSTGREPAELLSSPEEGQEEPPPEEPPPEEEPDDPTDPLKWRQLLDERALPDWARGNEEPPRSTDQEIGPAIPALRRATVLVLASQAPFFILVLWSSRSRCRRGASHGYTWWVWAAIVPVFLVRNLTEWAALRQLLPPYCYELLQAKHECIRKGATEGVMGEMANARAFEFGRFKLRFRTWVALYAVLTNLSLFDIFSDTAFAASVVADLHCKGSVAEAVWDRAWQSSRLASLPLIGDLPLHLLILCFWLAALLQTVWPLLATVRRREWTPEGQRTLYQREEGGDDFPVLLCSSTNIYNDDVFVDLAGASDMAGLIALSHKSAKAECALALTRNNGLGVVNYANTVGKAICMRVILTYLMENTIQVNLQASIYAISVFVENEGRLSPKRVQALLSLTSSVLMTLYRLKEARDFVKLAGNVSHVTADRRMWPVSQEILARFFRNRRWLLLYRAIIVLGTCIMALSLCAAAVRLAMAHVCKDAVVNLLDFNCIDEPGKLRPHRL